MRVKNYISQHSNKKSRDPSNSAIPENLERFSIVLIETVINSNVLRIGL